jgi:hypothetical protein
LDSERGTYIDSLEAADQGQLQPLIDLMAEKQQDLLYKATKEAQYLDFDETLTSIKESKAKYLGRLQKYRENFEKANLHISAWYDATREILNHYKGAVKDLPDLTTRTEEPFTWVEYDKIHCQNILQSDKNIIWTANLFTFAITWNVLSDDP